MLPGPDGWPAAYVYAAGGRSRRFDLPPPGAAEVAPILPLALFHPEDDIGGLAPIEAAATALDIHNAASAWNKALLDNAARPSGALVFAGAALSEAQFDRLKAELEANYQGAANAGRPLLLEGGLDWKPLALSPRDMDFVEAKNAAAREIALAFGVPPLLLGLPGDNTHANYAEANRALYRQTLIPLGGPHRPGAGHLAGARLRAGRSGAGPRPDRGARRRARIPVAPGPGRRLPVGGREARGGGLPPETAGGAG